MNSIAPEQLKAGQKLEGFRRRVTQEQVNAYALAAGDPNPIHTDADFARMVGLPGTIAHGLLSMGIAAEAVARWFGGYEHLKALQVRFSKPLFPGETLTISAEIVAVDGDEIKLELEATSSRGERVLTNGRATVTRPTA